jgi:leucyl aminopeptidase
MHAVGRGSKNVPVFINLKYNGNEGSDKWISFVGKGVCFDAGGLNIKPGNFKLIFSIRHERYVFR